eukprot:c6094_g1_i1 orf=288-1166(+)
MTSPRLPYITLLLIRSLTRPSSSRFHRSRLVKREYTTRNHWTVNLLSCVPYSLSTIKDLQSRHLCCIESKSMASTVPATQEVFAAPTHEETVNGDFPVSSKTPKVIFVLGGPGSGKGTQCAMIVEKFGFTHLSAGDLLRAEINSGSENGTMIQNMIKEGKIVPSEVTVKLLQKAMHESGNDKFLIDGFPRNEENRAAFEYVTGIQPEFILFFDCSEGEMEKRILGRNQGRVDDNIDTIRKRFKVFVESSLPVINYYEALGKLKKIDAARTREEVFQGIEPLFLPLNKVNGTC